MVSLSSSNIGIGLSVRLYNHFSGQASAISASMMSMHAKAKAVMADNLRVARNIGIGMTIAGGLMASGYKASAQTAADYNYILRGTQAVTGATEQQFRNLHDLALSVSKSTVFSATEVGNAMEYMGRAGYTVHDIKGTIDAVTALGAATDASIEGKGGVADMMTNMMTAFGMGAKSSMRMADVITKTTTRSNVNIYDLHEALKYLGSSASAVKMPFEEAAAAIGVLGSAGIPGSMAGRTLAMMLTQLSRMATNYRSGVQKNIMSDLGISPDMLRDSQGELKSLVDIAALFQNRLKDKAGVIGYAATQRMLGQRGARSFLPLLRATEIGMNLSELLKEVRDNSAGAALEIAGLRIDTLKGDSQILKDNWVAFKIAMGEAITPFLRFVIPKITWMIKAFTAFVNTPIGKPFVILGLALTGALLVAGPLLIAISSMGLLALTSKASFASMGASLRWAWNSAAAAATRYGLVARGVTYVSPTGVFAMKGVKGFQSAGSMAGSGLMGGFFKSMKGVIPKLGIFGRSLGIFGRLLGIATGPIGLILTIVGGLVGFKNMIKLVVYGLGTLAQSLFFVYDYVIGFFSGDFSGQVARDNFKRRQKIMSAALGMEDITKGKAFDTGYMKNAKYRVVGDWMDKLPRNKDGSFKLVVQSNVNLDGKQIADSVHEQDEEKLRELLDASRQ